MRFSGLGNRIKHITEGVWSGNGHSEGVAPLIDDMLGMDCISIAAL